MIFSSYKRKVGKAWSALLSIIIHPKWRGIAAEAGEDSDYMGSRAWELTNLGNMYVGCGLGWGNLNNLDK